MKIPTRERVSNQKLIDSSDDEIEILVCSRCSRKKEIERVATGEPKRLFSAISMNWRGKPLESYEAVVNLIGATTTRSGLRVRAKLDERTYERGIKVPREVTRRLAIRKHVFHGDWNYAFRPSV